ncbi:hypothetical protein SAMN04488544_2039 [Microlunatus sagamiharensis]|uniref:Uncharacterized protein n=1 Tax=Microlunatus sagamiharensis TaxID=546874 RepID=A0A1H2MGK0_9ACTN|nr:hypothetical protein [Microlunatus sagamiharensis]SDU92377.1 hypothetical protein SAMN04488544_2039 [Microlunatus sagamiharensis]
MSSPYYGPWTPGDPAGPPRGPEPANAEAMRAYESVDAATLEDVVPVSPLLPTDPPKVGGYWLDARLHASAAGTAFTAHSSEETGSVPAMVLLLSEGAAADAAARDRLAGEVNEMHIDTVLARGGQGQDTGRLGRRFVAPDTPVTPDGRPDAPWVALAYDGSPAAAEESVRVLDAVELAALEPLGAPKGPDYQLPWIERVRPGLARLWPLPWPGRYDRAGWRTILVSWLLMMLLAALAVLIAILIFRNQPPQSPPPPAEGTGSPPPASASPSPQSGSPSSSQSGSGSPSPSQSGSQSGSPSGSPSPSGTQSGSPSGGPSPGESGEPGSPTPPSRL